MVPVIVATVLVIALMVFMVFLQVRILVLRRLHPAESLAHALVDDPGQVCIGRIHRFDSSTAARRVVRTPDKRADMPEGEKGDQGEEDDTSCDLEAATEIRTGCDRSREVGREGTNLFGNEEWLFAIHLESLAHPERWNIKEEKAQSGMSDSSAICALPRL